MHRRLPKYLLFALLLYWAAMFVATHIPGDKMPEQQVASDKLLHFIAYAALAWLAAMSLRALGRWGWKSAIALVIVAAMYGAVDEWLQPYFNRSAEVGDWVADMVGVGFGLLVFYFTQPLLWRIDAKRKKSTATSPPAAS
jgi:VanZ family protein